MTVFVGDRIGRWLWVGFAFAVLTFGGIPTFLKKKYPVFVTFLKFSKLFFDTVAFFYFMTFFFIRWHFFNFIASFFFIRWHFLNFITSFFYTVAFFYFQNVFWGDDFFSGVFKMFFNVMVFSPTFLKLFGAQLLFF